MKRKRNMGELEEVTYLKTVGDLRQHIGQVLHYSYTQQGKEVAYMKKLTRVTDTYFGGTQLKDEQQIPKGLMTYGTYLVILKSMFGLETPCVRYLDKEHMSNCFEHIRIPTKDEMNIYRNLIRHARIFGLEEKS